uniref:Uncharacterized protein n=1 Tax=Hucho hucho TaxID=62062 RepID=A0A4W5LE83_9TELE
MSPKKGSETNTGRPTDSTGSTANVNKSTTLGSFYHLPTYLKLYDILKATHTNYKVHTHTLLVINYFATRKSFGVPVFSESLKYQNSQPGSFDV